MGHGVLPPEALIVMTPSPKTKSMPSTVGHIHGPTGRISLGRYTQGCGGDEVEVVIGDDDITIAFEAVGHGTRVRLTYEEYPRLFLTWGLAEPAHNCGWRLPKSLPVRIGWEDERCRRLIIRRDSDGDVDS